MAWRELAASGFYVATSPSSSFVYLLTGMHGIHLLRRCHRSADCGRGFPVAAVGRIRKHCGGRDRLVLAFHGLLWVYILCLLEFVH